jgi:hypothetical protein
MRYLVSRTVFGCDPIPYAVANSLSDADTMIADLESKDPKGTLIFYSREPLGEAVPSSDFRVESIANCLAALAE